MTFDDLKQLELLQTRSMHRCKSHHDNVPRRALDITMHD